MASCHRRGPGHRLQGVTSAVPAPLPSRPWTAPPICQSRKPWIWRPLEVRLLRGTLRATWHVFLTPLMCHKLSDTLREIPFWTRLFLSKLAKAVHTGVPLTPTQLTQVPMSDSSDTTDVHQSTVTSTAPRYTQSSGSVVLSTLARRRAMVLRGSPLSPASSTHGSAISNFDGAQPLCVCVCVCVCVHAFVCGRTGPFL